MKNKITAKISKVSKAKKVKSSAKVKRPLLDDIASENDTTIVFHKSNCNTSCTVMALLKKKKIKTETFMYLETPPTVRELEVVLAKLDIKPHQLIRTKEPYYQQKLKGLKLNDHEWIRIMVENPVLIERPILIKGNRAIIGRPIERVIEFIEK